MRNFLSKLNEFQCFLASLRRNVYQNYFKSLVYHGSFKVGMTHSYGNGRRLDDSKALAELNFEVNHIFIPTVIFAIIPCRHVYSISVFLLQSGDYLDVAIL